MAVFKDGIGLQLTGFQQLIELALDNPSGAGAVSVLGEEQVILWSRYIRVAFGYPLIDRHSRWHCAANPMPRFAIGDGQRERFGLAGNRYLLVLKIVELGLYGTNEGMG